MFTEFGKLLRKARIDHGLLLKDMAEGLGVSSAYLSAVETGKKTVSDELIRKVAAYLGILPNTPEYREIEDAAQISKGQISLEVRGLSQRHQETALAFARQFGEMQPNELDRLLALLQKPKK
ncbi:helix-turn-helix domain-containing protein [Aquipseudomonas guryensis]|uniref:Helix-turn-helix transcriptional regulator n=1 Tax=Aquipseudomonas guryensis TaxID=2759165 RepID=A0A7W4DAB8_9GAMM|nr:helix-turn-helix transcriptional regulator [Pseudomonas guryensis]MBB1518941.1 helix-turn-helix transcriptional regulator [Pseudomonas guryensis]